MIRVARGQMRNCLNAARLERTGERKRVHPDARERSAVDVDRVHALRSHHVFHLLENAFDRRALWRIDFHGDDELLRLNFSPQRAFRFARRDRLRLGGPLRR